MTGLVSRLNHLRSALPAGQCSLASAQRLALAALAVAVYAAPPSANADQAKERVKGYFCNEKTDSVAFLMEQARGENEIMAANAVNKAIAKFSCAYYLPADAIHTGEHTVMRDGLVFKLQSYVFLPEKVERWSGSVLGSLAPGRNVKHDV
jgi:hypothetical protein